MFTPGFQEMIVIGIIAVLLFGKRLPEVAKSLGKSYNEFRKGLADIHTSIDYDTYTSSTSSNPTPSHADGSYDDGSYDEYDDLDEPMAPKFAPPPSEPQAMGDDAPTVPKFAPPSSEPQPADGSEQPSGDIPNPVAEK